MLLVHASCLLWTASSPSAAAIERAAAALEEFRPVEAVEALSEPPRGLEYAQHVLWYEKLAIAHSYLEQAELAQEAFQVMLALEPGRSLPYTLSPKVTFLFEQARQQMRRQASALIDLGWQRSLRTVDRPTVEIEVVHDPIGLIKTASLHYRLLDRSWSEVSVSLPPSGSFVSVQLPAAEQARASTSLELYLVARDALSNEVLLVGSPQQPRLIDLRYEKPPEWYEHWWVWTAVGVVAAAGIAAAIVAATDREDPVIQGVASFP